MNFLNRLWSLLLISVVLHSCTSQPDSNSDLSVKNVMDEVITRLYKEVPPERYNSIDDSFMLDFLSEDEKQVLATQYQYFNVNVPVTVSLIRNTSQQTLPFWMEDAGFKKTDGVVKNDVYEYEVWQKNFDAGWVNLGINGFDMHRTVYFICVGPTDPNDDLQITAHYPEQYPILSMEKGAFTYHDWSDLKIVEYPAELEGQALFTTVRGRAREAHVKGAFRETKFPSSNKPDQIMLTWSGDPSNSINIQWRVSTPIEDGLAKYWLKESTERIAEIIAST